VTVLAYTTHRDDKEMKFPNLFTGGSVVRNTLPYQKINTLIV